MHQTFYIDVDEEISSVIDRLNKSMATDNYFVIPKRAIFLQSIVNLKLLKREADKVGKNITIVTQDEIGISMAQRAGIGVRATMDGLEPVSDVYSGDMDDEFEPVGISSKKLKPAEKQPANKQTRLNSIGSNEFYDQFRDSMAKKNISGAAKPLSRRIPVNSSNYARGSAKSVQKEEAARYPIKKTMQSQVLKTQPNEPVDFQPDHYQDKGKNLEKMFSKLQNNPIEKVGAKGGKTKKIFIGFVILCVVVFMGVAAYLFVPSADIVIVPNVSKNRIDINMRGGNIAQSDTSIVQVRVINEKVNFSLEYDVTGKKAVSGKKASGHVVIYNEYNSSPQTLVATTRLESENGKIFRLEKNVVVPGTTQLGGETKPGAIEVDIIADQAGSDFNIDPTRFTIPGFVGGPKFGKFYAISSAPISGGTSEGDSGGAAAVSQQDIDNAKTKAETGLKDKVAEMIAGKLQAGEIALPQAQKIIMDKSTVSVKVGDMVDSFKSVASANVQALVFPESDVIKAIKQAIENDSQFKEASEEISKIEYGNIDSNFENNTLDLKVYAEVSIVPDIDVEKIKTELLGKNDDQLGDILKKYASIKNVSVEFNPTFISRISQYANRVSIRVDTSGQ